MPHQSIRVGSDRGEDEADPSLSFSHRIASSTAEAGLRKGERTRRALKAAAAELLQSRGYSELRVTDVNERAGVSNALFYVYFNNKQDLTYEILAEFLAELRPHVDVRQDDHERKESIFASNLTYVRKFRANSGLMRCLLQFGDEVPEFNRLWQEYNATWHDRVTRAFLGDPDLKVPSGPELFMACASLGVMIDGLLRLALVEANPRLAELGGGMVGDDIALALLFTRLWWQALYAEELDWSPGKRLMDRLGRGRRSAIIT